MLNRVFNVVRVKEGLSYTPSAKLILNRQARQLLITAESRIDDVEKILQLMEDEVSMLRDGEVSDEEINKIIKSELLSLAQGIESNSEIADYYIEVLYELDTYGIFLNRDNTFESMTPNEVRSVSNIYLSPSRMAYIKSTPTITYNQIYIFISIIVIFIFLYVIRMLKCKYFSH